MISSPTKRIISITRVKFSYCYWATVNFNGFITFYFWHSSVAILEFQLTVWFSWFLSYIYDRFRGDFIFSRHSLLSIGHFRLGFTWSKFTFFLFFDILLQDLTSTLSSLSRFFLSLGVTREVIGSLFLIFDSCGLLIGFFTRPTIFSAQFLGRGLFLYLTFSYNLCDTLVSVHLVIVRFIGLQ